jgi:UDP-glucose 4-epimerase
MNPAGARWRRVQRLTQGYGDFYRGRRVLVTGGLGFIGSNLARRLVDLGAQVLLIDSMHPDYGGNFYNIAGYEERLRINISDVRDEHSLHHLVQGQEVIFNLAGQVSHIDSMADPRTDLEINCRSQLDLLEACRRLNPTVKIVYAGTRQIYGRPQYLPVDEAHPVRPVDVNGVNKRAGEMYHLLYWDVFGIPTCVLRLTNTYGPRMLMRHNRQGFLPWFVRQAIEGETITLFGTGEQRRDMNEVADVVEAFLRVGATDATNGRAYNLGHSQAISLREIVEILIDLCPGCDFRLAPFPEEKRRIDIGDYMGDFSLIRASVGWEPQVAPREGLERMVRYYQEHGRHYWEVQSVDLRESQPA